MTVCEKVPEMLLIIGPAIILGRHRGVSEPIITKRMKTVRKEEALPSPAAAPHTHPPAWQGPLPRAGGPGEAGLGPRPGPSAFYSSSQHLYSYTSSIPSFLRSFRKCFEHLLYASSTAGNETDMVPAHESSVHERR